MARRSSKKVLEWIYKKVSGAKATVLTAELDLDLRDNQIAEIWSVESDMVYDTSAVAGVDDEVIGEAYLSTDPNAVADPTLDATEEDAEIFYNQELNITGILDGTATSFQTCESSQHQKWEAPPGLPILVGTNVGMVFEWNTTNDLWGNATWAVRMYFTRRSASGLDLAHILLKRR